MGLTWMPYGFGVIVCVLVGGLSLACLGVGLLLDMPILQARVSTPRPPNELQLLCTVSRKPGNRPFSAIRQRLVDENVALVKLDAERERLHDSHFAAVAEQRIVWSELLDLELQDIDEQVSRIRHASRD
jgi:hypothetical protein